MSAEHVQIAHSAVTAKLIGASRELLLEVQAMLSYRVEGAEQTSAFQSGHWDGTSTFLNFGEATFPAGFVHRVQSKLQSQGHTVSLVRKPLPLPLGKAIPEIDAFGQHPNYSYQMETVDRLLRHGQIIAQVATGGGKSRICNLAVARLNRKCLFLTTRGVLMYQMRAAFIQALIHRVKHGGERPSDVKVGVLGDGEWIESNYINVGMVQTINARLEKKTAEHEAQKMAAAIVDKERKEIEKLRKQLERAKVPAKVIAQRVSQLTTKQFKDRPSDKQIKQEAKLKAEAHMGRRAALIELLNSFELVILEEAHEAGGNSYYDILKHCRSAHYRLALTATPFMRDDEESNMRLMACSGPIAIKVTEKMLIERGILAKPYFKTLPALYEPDKDALAKSAKDDQRLDTRLGRTSDWQRAYKLGVVYNGWRNSRIVLEVARAARMKQPAMVLVMHTAHGELLLERCQQQGLSATFIRGENDQAERKAALKGLADGTYQVVIGSNILDVGVDVPSVGLVVLAGGGKAEVALRQRIGRGLRAKKSGPNVAMILDFMDDVNFHLKSHSIQRRRIIESTPGFAEQLLPLGQDFDFRQMGLSA